MADWRPPEPTPEQIERLRTTPPQPWRPQPESRQGPDTFGAPGRVSGVVVCSYHRSVLGGLRTAHGSVEGHARRVRQIAGQCMDCLREQEEEQ